MRYSKISAILGAATIAFSALTIAGCPQTADATGDTSLGDSASVAADNNDSSSSGQPDSDTTSNSSSNNGDSNSGDNSGDSGNDSGDGSSDQGGSGDQSGNVTGDFNGDNILTADDVYILATSFGSNLPGGDLNADGAIDIRDLAALLSMLN